MELPILQNQLSTVTVQYILVLCVAYYNKPVFELLVLRWLEQQVVPIYVYTCMNKHTY